MSNIGYHILFDPIIIVLPLRNVTPPCPHYKMYMEIWRVVVPTQDTNNTFSFSPDERQVAVEASCVCRLIFSIETHLKQGYIRINEF